jgi:hypothetical protein
MAKPIEINRLVSIAPADFCMFPAPEQEKLGACCLHRKRRRTRGRRRCRLRQPAVFHV